MSYTSDRRMKNLFKDIHMEVLSKLTSSDLYDKIELRIFDESAEDAKEWNEGGLTFTDPTSGFEFGSNDCAWYYTKDGKAIPLVVVEGTFGTERGQFGDGQNNRFSHALGVARNGYTGVLFAPFHGESYSKPVFLNQKYLLKPCNIRRPIIKSALKVTEREKGNYFVIDAYNRGLLISLIIAELKYAFNQSNDRDNVYQKIIRLMSAEIRNFKGRDDQIIFKAYGVSENIINRHVRFFTQNLEALTTSQKRDGHGLFGKILLESYLFEKEQLCLFVRLTDADIALIKSKKSKEMFYIFNNCEYESLDGLVFSEELSDFKRLMYDLKDKNLHDESEKSTYALLKKYIEAGKIKIRSH